ncbi:uncharacterized protein LOC124267635 [Haliotis rubra]|uniref:uncharacterized protein LOC124267635 n=1 Tax=Haliotis rubra TaxID=36100 RepID=UPI001EE500BF|nr:uncharacterized protein LOC124267635 [Haliotis rubra]
MHSSDYRPKLRPPWLLLLRPPSFGMPSCQNGGYTVRHRLPVDRSRHNICCILARSSYFDAEIATDRLTLFLHRVISMRYELITVTTPLTLLLCAGGQCRRIGARIPSIRGLTQAPRRSFTAIVLVKLDEITCSINYLRPHQVSENVTCTTRCWV